MNLFKDERINNVVLTNFANFTGIKFDEDKLEHEIFTHAVDVFQEGGFVPNLSTIYNLIVISKMEKILNEKYPALGIEEFNGKQVELYVKGQPAKKQKVPLRIPLHSFVIEPTKWKAWINQAEKFFNK